MGKIQTDGAKKVPKTPKAPKIPKTDAVQDGNDATVPDTTPRVKRGAWKPKRPYKKLEQQALRAHIINLTIRKQVSTKRVESNTERLQQVRAIHVHPRIPWTSI